MRIEDRVADGVLVLSLKERRLDARNAPLLKDRLTGLISGGTERIVLDLSDVEFMDSSGLGAIMSALKLLGRKGDLVIAGASEAVSALFALTRMDKVFRMFATTPDALDALDARTP